MSNVLSCVFRSSKLLWLATLSDDSWNTINQSFVLWWSRFMSTYLSWLLDIDVETYIKYAKWSHWHAKFHEQTQIQHFRNQIVLRSELLPSSWCSPNRLYSTKKEIHRVVLFAFGRDWLYLTESKLSLRSQRNWFIVRKLLGIFMITSC